MIAVSDSYMDSSTIDSLREILTTQGFVHGGAFLTDSLFSSLSQWSFKLSRVPNKYSYASLPQNRFDFSSLNTFIAQLANTDSPSITYDVLSFSSGDYTLLHDAEDYSLYDGAFFLFFCGSWDPSWGGNFVIKDESDSYVVHPLDNTFVFVQNLDRYSFFIQYITALAKKHSFFVIRGLVQS